jgi:phosphatidylinositol alpha-mannosyltransferase
VLVKVAMLHADLPGTAGGGVPHQVSRLSDALSHRGHDVVVFTFTESPPSARYEVARLSMPRRMLASKVGRAAVVPLAFAAASYRAFDIVHAHGDSHLLFRRNIPVVRTFYGSAREEARHAERLRRKVMQRAVFVCELAARRTATLTVGISENSQTSVGALDAIIPCGVDRTLFRPGPKSSRPSILFVGTIGGRKRGHLVVEAFRREIRPCLPDCELWLVADRPVEGDGIRNWHRPSDEDVAGLYGSAWMLVHPSSYEGFGVPYIEAMASGTAIVSTANAGALELLARGGSEAPASPGLIVEQEGLGTAVVALLNDPEAREAMERLGRQRSARFDWQEVAMEYEQAYEVACRRIRSGRSRAR